jgi:hypothetical protein
MFLDRDTMQHTAPIPSIGVHFQQVSMDQGDTNNTYLMILSILGLTLILCIGNGRDNGEVCIINGRRMGNESAT